jgi:hypothetical protein
MNLLSRILGLCRKNAVRHILRFLIDISTVISYKAGIQAGTVDSLQRDRIVGMAGPNGKVTHTPLLLGAEGEVVSDRGMCIYCTEQQSALCSSISGVSR